MGRFSELTASAVSCLVPLELLASLCTKIILYLLAYRGRESQKLPEHVSQAPNRGIVRCHAMYTGFHTSLGGPKKLHVLYRRSWGYVQGLRIIGRAEPGARFESFNVMSISESRSKARNLNVHRGINHIHVCIVTNMGQA